jgi:hypothetical protein
MEKEIKNNLIDEIKNEIFDFYNLNIDDDVIEGWVEIYYENEDNEYCSTLFTDDNIPVFDTTEREDFLYYLDEIGVIELK